MVSKEGRIVVVNHAHHCKPQQTILLESICVFGTATCYRLQNEFSKGTPLVCACEKGRFEDALVEGHDVEKTGILGRYGQ